jgi:hypothetical protein
MYRVNKYVDLFDRTLWTFLITTPASLVVLGFNDWPQALAIGLVSALGTSGKVGIAQRTGNSGMGDGIPGMTAVEEVEITTDAEGRVVAAEA